MKIISYGETHKIYGNDLQTHDRLPAATYKIDFNMMSGFSLEKVDNFERIEDKIYGNHLEKIEKVLKSYKIFNRSLGLMLSGNKGMGKSLFVQLLSEEAIKMDLPVILVSKPYKGVADFIDSIDQEVLVIFDEFEKVFSMDNEQGESQNDLLGLFDGTSQKKRLYAVTVNKLHHVSEYMVSRPGRFHYHIRFDYPTPSEIEVYLKDKVEKAYHSEINHVVSFANRVKLNYDSLRAIAFELNQGYSFGAAISDLNILTTDTQRYDIKVHFSNGKVEEIKNQGLNLFEESINLNFYTDNSDWFSLIFDTRHIDSDIFKMIVDGEHVHLQVGEDNTVYTEDLHITSLFISHHKDSSVNYKLAY